MKKEKVVFDELLWEKYVKSNPKEFLGEDLKPLSKQKIVHTGRMDLTFRDKKNNIVIVEIQRYALDRKHFYRTLDYKADLEFDGEKNIRVVCLCNKVELKRKNYAKQWNLKIITIKEDKVKSIIKKINPNIEFVKKETFNQNRFFLDRHTNIESINELKKTIERKYEFDTQTLEDIILRYKRMNKIFDACEYYEIDWYNNRRDVFRESVLEYFKGYKSGYYWENESIGYLKTFEEFKIENHYRIFLHNLKNYNFSKLVEKDKDGNIKNIRKPKIELIFITDQYFGRDDLKVYWLPSGWKEKLIDKKDNDFLFSDRYFQYFTSFQKERHLIYNFQDVLKNGVVCPITADGAKDLKYREHSYLKNISGHIAGHLYYAINYLIHTLNLNFEVKTENPIKLVTEKMTEEDYLLKYKELPKNLNREKVIGFKIKQRTHIN